MTLIIIPFTSPKATLEKAGGKGANLARLTRARHYATVFGTGEEYLEFDAVSQDRAAAESA